MTAVLFEPHHDDAVLFATYSLLEYRPHVITVFGNARKQEPDVSCAERVEEQGRAFAMLGGFEWGMWLFEDTASHTWKLQEAVQASMSSYEDFDLILAPYPEPLGHEQHNLLGLAAKEVFGERVRYYLTYERGSGRSQGPNEVQPEKGWPALKFAAMGCYSSQIELESTRPWFAAGDCLREWRT